ncbi:ABC transporter ATP-binding protein [uncultured Oscillibacter sp.]|uniref:ABC transporter ATP-binding protein n=1 Tax=uncultured Oscillibacter sp. TaxID=876091 RepID=UPI0025CEA849|nr:ABC transporter ATP-binding protein [uncultured Oscillibacter sp.]
MSSPIIRFQEFSFQYKSQARPTLRDIDLSIYPGEKVLIAGPSGCGKSTLASCINGLIPFAYPGEQSGSLTICGEEAKDTSIFQLSKTVGTVLQDPDGQFIGLTVAEDIAFVLENACTPQEEMVSRVAAVSEKVGVGRHLDHAPDELSGGQKQRVSLAGVMIGDVKVFLFDEPLANLDPATGKQAIELIDQIHRDTQAAVIIIEHRLEDVLWRDVDRIVLMRDGEILLDSPPAQLLSTGLLLENGIREPLYLTAMRYAGVGISPEALPQSIRTLRLSEEDRRKIRDWGAQQAPAPAPGPREVLFSAEGIDFTYENGFHALKDVSLRIEAGELLAIVGTNGAGKTTFSKVICGFETPQAGVLRFKGRDLAPLSIKERADHIGYVMQDPNQMISKSFLFDEVALGLRLRGVPEEETARRVEKTLKICGLYPFRRWPVSALSFGQKKRVTIASILVLDPEMLILDEPTAGQDFRHYTEIMEFLRGLSALGIAVVMITHDMHLMLEYADRAVVFSQGRIIADDTSAGILTSPDIIRRASLKETSLYDLALMCGAEPPDRFVQRFIDCDREVRAHG